MSSGGGRTFLSALLADKRDAAPPELACVCESSVLDKLLALDVANAAVKLLNLRTGRARTLYRTELGFRPVRLDRVREERYALFQLRADGSGLLVLLEEQLRPKIVAFWKCVHFLFVSASSSLLFLLRFCSLLSLVLFRSVLFCFNQRPRRHIGAVRD